MSLACDGHREADGQPWIWRTRTSWVRRRCVALATSSGRAGRLVAAGTDAADRRRVVRQDREPTRDAGVVATRGAAVRAAGMSRASTQRLRSQRSSVAARLGETVGAGDGAARRCASAALPGVPGVRGWRRSSEVPPAAAQACGGAFINWESALRRLDAERYFFPSRFFPRPAAARPSTAVLADYYGHVIAPDNKVCAWVQIDLIDARPGVRGARRPARELRRSFADRAERRGVVVDAMTARCPVCPPCVCCPRRAGPPLFDPPSVRVVVRRPAAAASPQLAIPPRGTTPRAAAPYISRDPS